MPSRCCRWSIAPMCWSTAGSPSRARPRRSRTRPTCRHGCSAWCRTKRRSGRAPMTAVSARNISFVSRSDQGGRGDGVQVMVHRGYAYIGHGYSNGITVIDVRDAKHPKVVNFLPCPTNTRAIHLQTHGDLLLAVNGPSMWTMKIDPQAYYTSSPSELLKGQEYTAGVRIYDLKKPE